ncbi:MAG: radical SAM protein [Candidatus Heimdallarchaeota archaeon]|nr:MAG: radical SAM protein [Candidatus Heimdallarchaeota archaeon]
MRKSRLKEINVIEKPTRDVQWRIGLVYPNSYSVGMSGLTIKLLYHLLNQHQNIFVERVFFSETLPGPPKSIETGKILSQFDLLAFTFQFELDYINAIKMLLRSGIPVFAEDRMEDHPLLLAGGPTVTANPEPLFDIFDVFFSGEFESVAEIFLEAVISSKNGILSDSILSVPGFYTPDTFYQLSPGITSNLDEVNYPTAQVRPIKPLKKGVLDGYFLQISRGCTHGCHFCLIGKYFRPQRERSLPMLKNLIDRGTLDTKTEFFSLIGSSVADYSQLKGLLDYFIKKKLKFTLPSIRIDSGIDVLDSIKQTGLRSLSIAPETALEDVRFKIGKKISNSQISEFLHKADLYNIQEIRLYFILGLTSGIVSESQEIVNLVNNLADFYPIKLTMSVTPLIPKRGTKLVDKCVNYKEIQEGFNILKKNLGKTIRFKSFPVHWAAIQAILSIGGRELTPIMTDIANDGGSYQSWKKNFDMEPIDYYLAYYCR